MRNILKISLLYLLLGTLTFTCITPLDLQFDEAKNILVIEGFITDKSGPHLISISTTAVYGSVFDGVVVPEKNAKVAIRDSDGLITILKDSIQLVPDFVDGCGLYPRMTEGSCSLLFEKFAGYKTPDGFKAEEGKEYTLLIETRDGNSYTSLPQQLVSGPSLEKIEYEFVEQITAGNEVSVTGFEFYGISDDELKENFFTWNLKYTYRYTSNFEVVKKHSCSPSVAILHLQSQH